MPGASCETGPSPTARATRLDRVRADGPGPLADLLAALAVPPPWDAQVAPGEPLAAWLRQAGFAPYAETVLTARRLEGMRSAPPVPGVAVAPHRQEWADAFREAEAEAMADDPFYLALGGETGFADAAGHGAFVVARRGDRVVGFAQAAVPEGWINWVGVVPGERRRGVGRALLTEVARAVAAARGTHLTCETVPGGPGHAFLAAQGFRDRGRQEYLLRAA
ncbi:MAG: GNAT family N-acetyltransferase [Actinomycetota bacterium]